MWPRKVDSLSASTSDTNSEDEAAKNIRNSNKLSFFVEFFGKAIGRHGLEGLQPYDEP